MKRKINLKEKDRSPGPGNYKINYELAELN